MRVSILGHFFNECKIINLTPNNNHCVKPQVSDFSRNFVTGWRPLAQKMRVNLKYGINF